MARCITDDPVVMDQAKNQAELFANTLNTGEKAIMLLYAARAEIKGWQEAVKTVEAQRDSARLARDHYRAEKVRLAEAMRKIAKYGEEAEAKLSCQISMSVREYESFSAWAHCGQVASQALSSLSEPKEQQP